MVAALGRVADEVLGAGAWFLDDVMRQIPDHFHAHARDPNWWARRMERLSEPSRRAKPRDASDAGPGAGGAPGGAGTGGS